MSEIIIMKEKAEQLLDNNHRIGELNGQKYDYTCPSPNSYPHQWIWDSSFHAIVLSHFDQERSKKEIKTLVSKQKDNGFISCVNIWESRLPIEGMFYITRITQPPVIPIAVETIYQRTGDKDFVQSVYPNLKRFLGWLSEKRDEDGDGLIRIIHPWEDGDDGNPSFDKQIGFKDPNPSTPEYYFKFFKLLFIYSLMGWDEEKIVKSRLFSAKTVLFNSIYAKSLYSMSNLAEVLGNSADANIFRDRHKKTLSSLIEKSWNEEDQIFYDLGQKDEQSKVKTVSSLMALIIPDLPKKYAEPLIEKHLLNPAEFWTEYPIASVSKDEKAFDPNGGFRLWRGPMWVNTNWFLANALMNFGYKKESATLTQKTEDAVNRSGFREFYNPFTGEGYGQKNFGWSTLVLDMTSGQ